MAENHAALTVFAAAGFELARELEAGEVELRFSIVPTEEFRARVEERDHIAVAASLRPFFRPASVAVIGASRRRGSIGGELFRNVLEADFEGVAYPVNVSGDAVAGVRAYRSIEDIPDPVDLAVVCVPGARVLEAAESALRKGVRALCVISAGFAESGAEGRRRQDRLLALVREHGARLVGPNCLGIAVPPTGLNATFAPRALPPGPIGFSSQSGALGLALLEEAAERRLGFSSFVSIGNKADVSSNDLLEWWEDDPETELILLYLESFGNPRAFGRLARRIARSKPILALKAGSTGAGAKAASSHTAALAGSEAAVDALFHQAGVLRARTLEEFVDAAGLLASQPLPRGRRVAVVTNAGGLGILAADACEASGLTLPDITEGTREALAAVLPREASLANPIDLIGSAGPGHVRGRYPAAARRSTRRCPDRPVRAARARGSRRGRGGNLPRRRGRGAARQARARRRDQRRGNPRCAARERLGHRVLLLPGDGCARARSRRASAPTGCAGRRAQRRSWKESTTDRARGLVEEWLSGSDRALARPRTGPHPARGVRHPARPRARRRNRRNEAVAAAGELGYPVVVKTAEPGAHKTEHGGVALDLRDEEAVRTAASRIGVPVIVQRFVTGGTELLAGAVQDPVFGPLVAFGPGGVLAELIGEAGFRIAPLTAVDAEELVHGGKAGRLVAGFRGAPAADAAALEQLVLRLARLADDIPEVAELDLNPVLALPDGCMAVDARVRLRARPPAYALKSW